MTYFAYLDEFGHIGPYVSRTDPKYHDSPVFGLAGYVLPSSEVRAFGTWFFQRKRELLDFEIKRSGEHPALWEKKGASLYTVQNVTKYAELRHFTNHFFNKVGLKKTEPPHLHRPNSLYAWVLLEAIKRIDAFCAADCKPPSNFILALDQHDQRSRLITTAAQSMYGGNEPRRHLIEPPFHLESYRYQTVQAADWLAGLIGRIGAIWACPAEYSENEVFRRYFEHRLNLISRRSGIRTSGASGSSQWK